MEELTQEIKKRRSLLLTRVDRQRRLEIFEEVVANSSGSWSFYLMTGLSTAIAAFGLLSNSTAVVIGAMVLAPLMMPILGVAMALTVGDKALLWRAVVAELIGALLAVTMGFVIGSIPWQLGIGSEILARTQPTIYDILVGLIAGLAGGYALMDERIGTSLPGVAIAVALVPPLAACGICLSQGRLDLGTGAFLLFFANFLSIHIAAAFVFTVFGMHEVRPFEQLTLRRVFRRFWLSLLALVLVGLFMTRTLLALVAERRYGELLQSTLETAVRSAVGAHVDRVSYERRPEQVEVTAVVLTPHAFEPADVERVERKLQQAVDPQIHLVLRSLLSKDADRHGAVYELPQDLVAKYEQAEAVQQAQFLEKVSQTLRAGLESIPGSRLGDLRRVGDDSSAVLATIESTQPLRPAQVAEWEQACAKATGKLVKLTVSVVPAQTVSAEGYLNEQAGLQAWEGNQHKPAEPAPTADEPTEPTPRELAHAAAAADSFQIRLRTALQSQLRDQLPGAVLRDFRFASINDRKQVFAVALTPVLLTTEQVAVMQAALRKYVEPDLDLVVRSLVGSDLNATGPLEAYDETKLGQPYRVGE